MGLFWISVGLFSMIGYCAEGTICNDRRPSQNLARGLEGAVTPLQWVQGRALVRPPREKIPRKKL